LTEGLLCSGRRVGRFGGRGRFEGLNDDLFGVFESTGAHPPTDDGFDFRAVNFDRHGLHPPHILIISQPYPKTRAGAIRSMIFLEKWCMGPEAETI
jgi:hypothetical protein